MKNFRVIVRQVAEHHHHLVVEGMSCSLHRVAACPRDVVLHDVSQLEAIVLEVSEMGIVRLHLTQRALHVGVLHDGARALVLPHRVEAHLRHLPEHAFLIDKVLQRHQITHARQILAGRVNLAELLQAKHPHAVVNRRLEALRMAMHQQTDTLMRRGQMHQHHMLTFQFLRHLFLPEVAFQVFHLDAVRAVDVNHHQARRLRILLRARLVTHVTHRHHQRQATLQFLVACLVNLLADGGNLPVLLQEVRHVSVRPPRGEGSYTGQSLIHIYLHGYIMI